MASIGMAKNPAKNSTKNPAKNSTKNPAKNLTKKPEYNQQLEGFLRKINENRNLIQQLS